MNNYILRAVAMLLAFAMLFGCSSCSERTEEYDETLRVEIIREDIAYTDEYVRTAEDRFVSIVSALIEHYGGALNVYQISKIRAQFRLNVIPMLYRIKIYDGELNEIFARLEEYVKEDDIPPFFTLIYNSALDVLGTNRCARLFHGTSLLILNAKVEKAEEKFNEYGFSWYGEEAERCRRIKSELQEMGEDRFTEAMSIFTSLISLGASIKQSDLDGAFRLEETSILYVIRYRTRIFTESAITEDEWALIGSLFTELIPQRSSSFESSMLYEMKKVSYLSEATRAMPELVALYSALAVAISDIPDVSFTLPYDEQAKVLATALLECESELYALCEALTEHAASDETSQRSLIVKHFGKEALEGHAAISYDELITELEIIAAEGGIDALYDATVSYLYGIAPYLTLAYLGNLGERTEEIC